MHIARYVERLHAHGPVRNAEPLAFEDALNSRKITIIESPEFPPPQNHTLPDQETFYRTYHEHSAKFGRFGIRLFQLVILAWIFAVAEFLLNKYWMH